VLVDDGGALMVVATSGVRRLVILTPVELYAVHPFRTVPQSRSVVSHLVAT